MKCGGFHPTREERARGDPRLAAAFSGRSLLRPGMKADVVIFDPATVADRAVFGNPHQYAVGFTHALVNGELALDEGRVTDRRPGRILYGPGYKK